MNREWMLQQLDSFRILCERYERDSRNNRHEYTDYQRNLTKEMQYAAPTVRQVLQRLDPSLVERITEPTYMSGASDALGAVREGLGTLKMMDEWAENLAPDSPTLAADGFHPHVWIAASAIWSTEQYRVAVQQSAVALSAHIAQKARSNLTERKLVAQVLAPSLPAAGQTRLHFAGDRMTDTWKSQQEGLHLVAQGAFAGIRNVATHTVESWTEHVALEQLAVLSVVARWIDNTELVRPPQ